VHSGPEPSRHADNFNPSTYDLWDTYLPAFKELVVNAKVAGVMCAYNAINNQPCCANDLLMNDILRRQWNFTGYVTSDCWAIDDFFTYHKTHKDTVSAAIDALIHGTDVECGVTVYKTLVNAVKTGLMKESQLDVSLRRLFMIRYRLGMFDPSSMVKYAQTSASVLENDDHKAHALKMARQSIVLLKNESSLLPLKKSLKKIVVLGPNAQNTIAELGNYNGTPSKVVSIVEGIKTKLGSRTQVLYEQALNFTNDTLLVINDAITGKYSYEGKAGVKAEYFTNEKLEGTPAMVRMESTIDHSWQEGEIPAPGIAATHFSARYTTNILAEKNETIHFQVEGDDGYRLYVNGVLKIDAWLRNRWGAKQFTLPVIKDSTYKLIVEYYQGDWAASIKLKAGNYVRTDFDALAAKYSDADAFIFAGGISPQLEGEEMPVNMPGFNGGDRTSILLPAVQTSLLKALKKTGKPVVFVMLTGSAIAVPWEDENIPAIVNAWYGGQSAGTALADVLFGDYNPAGRLPVTFYKTDSDLPDFSNYSMTGRTYRYFKGEALYPFGYGLSFTNFTYSALKLPASIAKSKPVTIAVTVTNTGKTDGEEVVQVYLSNQAENIHSPVKALKAFKRIYLKAGESKQLSFTLTPENLSLVGEDGKFYQPKTKMLISIGGGQPGIKNKTTSNVLSQSLSIL
jgi:beta-glucosidase